jgi:hypothetical protein
MIRGFRGIAGTVAVYGRDTPCVACPEPEGDAAQRAVQACVLMKLPELELVVEPLLVPPAAVPDWACNAAIKLCMNCWNAALAVLASELEVVLEEVVL